MDRERNLAAFLAGNHPKVPRVLYHGTNKDFSIHDPEMLGSDEKTSHQTSQLGHWFTGNPAQASEYAIWKTGRGANVQPVHISLKKPAILDWDDIQEKDGWDLQQKLIRKGHDGAIVHSNGPNLNYVVFTPHQIKSATGNQGTFDPSNPDITKGDGGEVDGITAYHGSPHEFDKFDLSEINEKSSHGQNFGHGLYFAENEPTAFEYKKPSFALDSDPQGHMYEVHIDAHPDHFLDWDKPLSEQSYILKAIDQHIGDPQSVIERLSPTGSSNITGQELYEAMGGQHKASAVSQRLHEMGIHGIKYVDYKARGNWNPETGNYENSKHNYVVFDHDRVNIKRRYAEGGDVERDGFGFGGDTVGAGSRPERGATGSAVAAREAPQPSYRDMPEHLQQAQHDLSFKNEQVINAMKEANAADKQHKAEQMTAWAGAGFPAGGPASMQVGEETRPTAYAMSDISKKSPVMQPQADIIASLAPPPQHYESSVAGNQIAYAPIPQRFEPTIAQNQIAAAPMPQHYEPTFAQNQIAPAPQQVAFKQPARPISPTPVNKPIQLASLDSSTFKPASPMPDFQPQTQDRGPRRRLVKKLMPDGTYQDVWEEYAHGGVAKYHSNHHNPAIVEYALNKISAPPPALDPTLMVAKRGRPF